MPKAASAIQYILRHKSSSQSAKTSTSSGNFRNRFNSFVGNSKHALVNRAPRNKITLNQNTDGLMKDFDDPLLSLNMHNAPSDMDGVDDSTSPSLQKDKKVTRGLICESYGNTNNHVSRFNCVVHSMLLYKSNE